MPSYSLSSGMGALDFGSRIFRLEWDFSEGLVELLHF